ncbi:hypothetical protein FZC83_01755 [Rossellomorea marisflavi]|uniref:Uncharacterized protein n=1 Tax=Rossellomorea marisflavi TaxID=189381 RepID=A0A5D4RZB9_9BACI|nr:hypothetical protein [Rossellomorea marisflavi]TYS56320.1 hypothetical protein FZC83_01755 [Rossellomorea marisflavi]
MNKRIRKKKATQRYKYGIEMLSVYCELPKGVVTDEVGEDLKHLSVDLNEWENDLDVYLDCKAIDLMRKYKTGWFYREVIMKEVSE